MLFRSNARRPERPSGQYPVPADHGQPSGQYPVPAGHGEPGSDRGPAAYVAVPDSSTGVALPVAAEAPLPLEAEALRAASAARRPRQAARRGTPAAPVPVAQQEAPAPSRQRRAERRRMATERLFADLATLAGIPADSYAVGDAVDGALCLVQTEDGFEVFHSAGGVRHELQVFATEESACFYLFGVLAAEAVRNGSLAGVPAGLSAGQPQPG